MQISYQKNVALSFLKFVSSGGIEEAYKNFISVDFRHHNVPFSGDRESLKKGMMEHDDKYPNKVLEVKHIIEEGGMVVTHSHLRFSPEDVGMVVIHIFRFEKNMIVELWDVGKQIPELVANQNGVF